MAGEHIGSHPPYGYMKNPENKKEWIVDEEAAEVIQQPNTEFRAFHAYFIPF